MWQCDNCGYTDEDGATFEEEPKGSNPEAPVRYCPECGSDEVYAVEEDEEDLDDEEDDDDDDDGGLGRGLRGGGGGERGGVVRVGAALRCSECRARRAPFVECVRVSDS